MPFYISEGFLFIIIFEQSFAIDKSKVSDKKIVLNDRGAFCIIDLLMKENYR